MCICCASSSDDAFEKLHEVESRAAKIKPHLDLAVGVWPCGRVVWPCGFGPPQIEISIVCGLIF